MQSVTQEMFLRLANINLEYQNINFTTLNSLPRREEVFYRLLKSYLLIRKH